MEKKKILRYSIYALFFIMLIIIVSFSAIHIKYKIIDYEIANTDTDKRLYHAYYNSLTYREQLLYNSITESAGTFEDYTEIIQTTYSMEDFQHVISCIRADRPDLFYVSFDELVIYHARHKTKVKMVYIDSQDKIEKMIADYENAVDTALMTIDPLMSEFEKEVALSDYIIDNCKYSVLSQEPLESTAYGALVLGEAVCDGYAYAVKELLNSAYIDTLVVYGTANDAEHVWNMVNIDSKYYHLDITWNDSDNNEGERIRFHGYFNLSDTAIRADHKFDNKKGTLPAATEENTYYMQLGCYTDDQNELEEIFYNSLKNAVQNNKQEYIELEYTESCDNTVLKPYFSKALDRVNKEFGEEILYDAFSVRKAHESTNAITIQIFYN